VDLRSVDRIRKVSFALAVRGYDRNEVDRFLAELADWLEGRTDQDANAEAVREELERIGEQTANILTDAHDAGQTMREEAQREVRQTLVDANLKAEAIGAEAQEHADALRADADDYARKTRADADGYALRTREEVDAYATETRADADAYARGVREEAEGVRKEARGEAERDAKRVLDDANRRRRDMEAVISDLEQRRDGVLNELEKLASGLAGTATQHRGTGTEAAADSADGDEPATKAEPKPQTAQKSK
jgi:DivIVA domain-containing protein